MVKSNTLSLVLMAGLLVGTLDISSAFIDYYLSTGKNPLNVLPYIASGAVGQQALAGGKPMMVLGLVFHYIIAYSFTGFFFLLYPLRGYMPANRVLTGILYGLFIWLVMNLLVVQLSLAPHAPIAAMKAGKVIKSLLILICMIGLPLSFIAAIKRPAIVTRPPEKPAG